MADDSGQRLRDECYRCGYDLRGIDDQQPCPECGLLAQRSRRETDELHDSRPRWLRRLSLGMNLILIGIVLPVLLFTFPMAAANIVVDGPLYALDCCALIVALGMIILTGREGFAPTGRADRWLRNALRLLMLAPLGWLAFVNELEIFDIFPRFDEQTARIGFGVAVAISSFIPLLLFLQLRGLAHRVRSPHLAKHCAIVGIGATIAGLYTAAVFFFRFQAECRGKTISG
jgi:hypothetical protein